MIPAMNFQLPNEFVREFIIKFSGLHSEILFIKEGLMKRIIPLAALILLISISSVFALTGREIMENNDRLSKPDSGRSNAVMNIAKGGRTTVKELEMLSKKKGGNDRVLISFTKPTRIKLLTHSYKGRDDDQWLMLSSGKVKRIISDDKDKPFVNSHFYYEDLETRELDGYEYKYLGDGSAVGADCYMVQAVKKQSKWVYEKSILYVRKSDYFVVRIDIYKNGSLHKYLENHDVKRIKGILTPFKAVMHQGDGKGRTELIIKAVDYNMPLRDSLFSKEALR